MTVPSKNQRHEHQNPPKQKFEVTRKNTKVARALPENVKNAKNVRNAKNVKNVKNVKTLETKRE